MSTYPLKQALTERRTCRTFTDQPVPLDVVRRLIWAAQGKTGDDRKRTAPSAHALFPLSLLVTIGHMDEQDTGVYKVDSDEETLVPTIQRDVRMDLQDAALEEQGWIGNAAGIITICADMVAVTHHFSEQPPLGARGLRYAYIEAGAASQNIHLQATAEGLGCVLVAGFKDEAAADVLELEAPIAPVLHMCFGWPA